ncbi:hypothetical protein [Candidatus Mycoplasma haematohominis]|uniref:hypothetical protein n=1 Tax=Candidatus Mycoplasma haematohominis TaxID=1494318 RepID=UPI001C0A76B5|nr:hypothetical protein [Candidatus Mycoplasma haemohominis]
MDPTKAAVASGVVALAVGTGYGVSTLFNNVMPDYSARQKPDPSDGKYVSNYPDYFVNADDNSNDPWWDWVYKERYQLDVSLSSPIKPIAKFESLKSGFEIKGICKSSYAENASGGKIKQEISAGGDGKNEYLEANVWRYCTAVNKKPTDIPDAGSTESYNSGTYGAENKGKLAAINDVSNDSFWKEQQRLFFKGSGGRSGSQTTEENVFKNLWDTKKGNLKDTCKLAYETTKKENDTNFKKDLFKFCSLKGTES